MKTLEQKIRELSPKRQAKVRARTRELVAREMSLRELRHAVNKTQKTVARTLNMGQDGGLAPGEAERLVAIYSAELCGGGWGKVDACGPVPSPGADCDRRAGRHRCGKRKQKNETPRPPLGNDERPPTARRPAGSHTVMNRFARNGWPSRPWLPLRSAQQME